MIYSTSTPAVCTAGGTDGSEISFVAPGTCPSQADQPGNALYNPAPPLIHGFGVG